MSNVSTFESRDTIRQQASLWISRLDRGLSAAEKLKFSEWVNQSESHKHTVFHMANLWDDMTVLHELSELFPLESEHTKSARSSNWVAIAASVTFAVLVGAAMFWSGMAVDGYKSGIANQNRHHTTIGQTSDFSLPDGSIARLNTDSEIAFDFSENKRVVYLNKGEAQFDVVEDKNRPFTVVSGEKSFTALGTIFNVEKRNVADMELIVTEGRVLITDTLNQVTKLSDKLLNLPEEELPGVLVTTGEKVVVADGLSQPIKEVSANQLMRELAWQQGSLVFEAEPLSRVLEEVSRYTNTNFAILDKEIANYKVSGFYKTGEIDSLLKALESNFNIRVSQLGERQISLQLN